VDIYNCGTQYSIKQFWQSSFSFTTHHNHFTALFRDHPGELVPEENFWTLWCKGRLTEADTLTIWLGATPSRLTSFHLHHPPIFLQARCPSCSPTNSIKALKATSAFRLRRCYSSPQQCYLHRLHPSSPSYSDNFSDVVDLRRWKSE